MNAFLSGELFYETKALKCKQRPERGKGRKWKQIEPLFDARKVKWLVIRGFRRPNRKVLSLTPTTTMTLVGGITNGRWGSDQREEASGACVYGCFRHSTWLQSKLSQPRFKGRRRLRYRSSLFFPRHPLPVSMRHRFTQKASSGLSHLVSMGK